jgi:hypothetical protein
MTLSSLIVQREIATIREVEEALARQVLYGGDLVTNLLEVARLDEEAVTPLLAESFGMPVGPIGELPSSAPDAKKLLPAELASRRSVYPLAIEEGNLVVAVANPLDRDAEKEIERAAERPLEQRIAPMVRLRQAIAREYGIPLERRLQRLLQRMAGAVSPSGMPSAPPPGAANATPQAPPPSRTGFEQPAASAPAPETPPHSPKAQSAPPPSVQTPRTLIQRHATQPRPQRRRRGPLHHEAAVKELEEAQERDVILDLLFDFSRQFFDYTVLFVVQHDLAEGRDAFGDGASRERVVGLGVPLDAPSALATARDRAEASLLVPSADGLDDVLWKDLQLTKRNPVLVVPVVVGKRVVALLLGDSGEAGPDEGAKKDVASFARHVGHAFQRLIVAKKKSQQQSRPPAVRHDTEEMKAAPAPETQASPAVEPEPARQRPSSEPPTRPEPAIARNNTAPYGTPVVGEPIVLTQSDLPPPATVVVVRKPAGPPIPREDPPDLRPRGDTQRRHPEPQPPTRRQGRGALALSELEDERGWEASASAPSLEEREMGDEEARALLAEIEGTPRPPVSSKAAPSSDHAVSVPAHLPPSKRFDVPKDLPSVIVDVDSELVGLVERFTRDSTDEQAEAELLRLGAHAMPAIMAKFPGPVLIKAEQLSEPYPRVVDCGPILRLIARQRRVALPFVLERIDSPEVDVRIWATFLLSELAYPEAAERLLPRLFDPNPRVRRVARVAARAVAEVAPAPLVERLGKVALQAEAPAGDRIAAIDTLGEIREPLAVPVLIGALADSATEVSASARAALMLVARQDFGLDARRWNLWWSSNAAKHRIEWLIDALDHDISGIRKAASDELRSSTREFFGYSEDLPKKERERAQQRYREWWSTDGRMRFRRL